MAEPLADGLAHVLGLLVRDDRDGITEIAETQPALLHQLRAAGLAVWRHDGWHPTRQGRDAYDACTTYQLIAVQPPAGIGLEMGAALQRDRGRNRT